MDRTVLAAFVVLALLSAAPAAACSCTASDGSCSAGATCPGGGIAICQEDGNCSAKCLYPLTFPDVSLTNKFDGAPRSDVAAFLSTTAAAEFDYVPRTPGASVSMDLRDVPFETLVEHLGRAGVVVQRGEKLFDHRLSFTAERLSAGDLSELLERALGTRTELRYKRSTEATFHLKDVPLGTFFRHLEKIAHVEWPERPGSPPAR